MRFLHRLFLAILLGVSFCAHSVAALEWRQLVRGTWVLHCHEEDLENGRRVLSMADEALPRMTGDFGLSSTGMIHIVIAPSEQAFHRLTGGQIPEWGSGAADPSQAMIFLKSPRFSRPETNLRQVVHHELSHVLLWMAVDSHPVDRWFDEGLAQLESGEMGIRGAVLLARSLLSGDIIWLDEVDEVLKFRREKAALAYGESRAAIDYLIASYGRENIGRIIQAIRAGKTMDDALMNTIGIGFQDFQTDWYHAMKQKYRWYILLDFWVMFSLVLVILFFTAFFVTRNRTRRIKQRWAEEEQYGFETMEERTASG